MMNIYKLFSMKNVTKKEVDIFLKKNPTFKEKLLLLIGEKKDIELIRNLGIEQTISELAGQAVVTQNSISQINRTPDNASTYDLMMESYNSAESTLVNFKNRLNNIRSSKEVDDEINTLIRMIENSIRKEE